MNTPPERYTAEQMLEAAAFHESMIGKNTLDMAAHGVLAAMLRQSASDVRGAERYRWLREPDAPTAEVCLVIEGEGSRFIDGDDLDQAIDTAMGDRDE